MHVALTRTIVVLALALGGVAAWLSSEAHRAAADTGSARQADTRALLITMLDESNAAIGAVVTGNPFAELAFAQAKSALAVRLAEASAWAREEGGQAPALVARQAAIARTFQRDADARVAAAARSGPTMPGPSVIARSAAQMQDFRDTNGRLARVLDEHRRVAQRKATVFGVGGVAVVLVFGLVAFLVADRRATRALREVARLAVTDPLTGLPNARALRSELDEAVAVAHRTGRGLAVAMLDLDRFKQVNDTHGHAVGDQVLVAAARAARSALRPGDVLGRSGGEEFVLVLPGADRAAAAAVAERVREQLHTADVPVLTRTLTGSLGVAVLGDDGPDTDALLAAADRAMYAAKAAGRDRVCTTDAPPVARAA